MSDLNEALNEAIRKHLPEQMGVELRKLLEEAANQRGFIAGLQGRLNSSEHDLTIAKAQLTRHHDLNRRETEFATREAALVKAEQEVAIKDAVLKATEAEKATHLENLKQIVSLVFQNNKLKYTRIETEREQEMRDPHNSGYRSPVDKNIKTTSIEEGREG